MPFNEPSGNDLALNGTGTTASGGSLVNVSGNNTWAGNIVMQSSSTINAEGTTKLNITGTLQDLVPNTNGIPTATSPNLTKTGLGAVYLEPSSQTVTLQDQPTQNALVPSVGAGTHGRLNVLLRSHGSQLGG